MSASGSNSHEGAIKKTKECTNCRVDKTEQIKNSNIERDANLPQKNADSPKKKNARKKENLKNLQIPIPNSMNSQPSVQTAPPIPTQNGIYSVHDFFLKQVTPLYAHTSSRYLENLAQHPQFHYMQHVQFREMFLHYQFTTSLPNTPVMHQGHSSNSPNFSNSPYINNSQQPKFFQNAMQHPLLSQTFTNVKYSNMQQHNIQQHNMQHYNMQHYNMQHRNMQYYNNVQLPPGFNPVMTNNSAPNIHGANSNTPTGHKNNQKKQENEDKKFDPYFSIEQVKKGLKNKTLFEGVIRINPKQFQHAYVSNTDRNEQDILIDGVKNRNRALEGDVVIVQFIETENEKKEENKAINENKENKQIQNSEKDQQSKQSEQCMSMSETKSNIEINPCKNDTENELANSSIDTKVNNSEQTRNNNDSTQKKNEKEENQQKRGKVVFIKEMVHNRSCIGNLRLMPDKSRQRALFVPRDYRIPRLNIPFTNWPDNFYQDSKNYENTLFLAKIDEWNDIRYAIGTITCNIGQSGDMQTETRAILAQTDLDVTPFGPEVRDLYPQLDYIIPEEEIKLREDCRKLCIFSIDPSNCRDIDDAVSCKKLDNGNYEIGVHISDVSHYLTENTILDEKVAGKATTIYLVEKAFHMLPDDLCMLCSLFPGVDKLAFSVFWEISDSGKIISHRFAKTVIHSCCQLAYEHAQAVLDNKVDAEESFPEIYNGYCFQDVHQTIKVLGKLSAIFRKQRFEGGALSINQTKISFHLSPTNGMPDSLSIYESKESHQLIEEFMLLANMTVAKRIIDDHPRLAFLRCHPAPSIFMLKNLANSLKPMGIDLEISSAGDLHRSLLIHSGPNADKGKAMVLNMLCAKPMMRAKYFCAASSENEDFHHYALNVPLYTHFTSPIRRYADIMVHRLLSASLKYRKVPNWDVKKVCSIAAQCNKQKYNAKRAGELSIELYTLKYIELHSPLVTDAVVVDVREKYIDVIIVAMGLNRKIFFNSDFPGEFNCIKNDAGLKLSKMEVKWKEDENLPEITQTIEVFSILQVEMHKGDEMVKVETKLVRPK